MDSNKKYRIPEHLLHSSDQNNELNGFDMAEIERILDIADSYSYPESRTEKNWQKFSATIQSPLTVTKKPLRFAMFRWAAAAIVLLTMGLGVWQYTVSRDPGFTAIYKTSTDSKSTQNLPDGSKILINKGSVLEVKAMNAHKRVLELKSGEVFLSVQHIDIPFRVITKSGIVTVMGTEFTISSIENEHFSLFLKSGSIQFETGSKLIVMQAGEYLEEVSKGKFVLSKINDNRSYAWITGKLSFENTSLSEVVKGLETLYHVEFTYDAKLSTDKLTITFDNLSAHQAAELLSKTINSKVEVK